MHLFFLNISLTSVNSDCRNLNSPPSALRATFNNSSLKSTPIYCFTPLSLKKSAHLPTPHPISITSELLLKFMIPSIKFFSY